MKLFGKSFFGKGVSKEEFLKGIESGNVYIVKEYIQNHFGENLNIKNNEGQNILSISCKKGFSEIVKKLIENGVDINTQDESGQTPLMLACTELHTEITKFLIENGADVNLKDKDGNTALNIICSILSNREKPKNKITEKVVNMLISGADEDILDNFLVKDIKLYIIGYIEIVKFLIENGADVNLKDEKGRTILIDICRYGGRNRMEINFFLRNNNNKEDYSGSEYIDIMIYQNILTLPLRIAKLLIEHGADVNFKDNIGYTALIEICYSIDLEMTKLLIESGADVNVQMRGTTPLMITLGFTHHTEMSKFLIENGADVNFKDDEGKTPIIRANEQGNIEIVKLIKSLGGFNLKSEKGGTELLSSVNNGNIEKVKLLIKNGADINIKDDGGISALTYACIGGHKKIVKLLIENGADVNIKDNEGNTTLSTVYKYGYTEIVKLLIENGADVNIYIDQRKTILHKKIIEGDIEMIKLLIKNGADVDIKENLFGVTGLMLACIGGHKEIVELLIKNGADINIKDNNGRTALTCAKNQDIISILKLAETKKVIIK